MLDIAYNHKPDLERALNSIAFDERYKFFNDAVYQTFNRKIDDDSWSSLQCVSVAKGDGRVLGYMKAAFDREAGYAQRLAIASFEQGNLECARDIRTFMENLFLKFGMNKIRFTCVIGNPVERTYDRLAANYGGRVVGVFRQETRLWDGRLYDVKAYEILRSEFMAATASSVETVIREAEQESGDFSALAFTKS